MPDEFEREYYEQVYRDYEAQNPARKLSHYESIVRSVTRGAREVSLLDFGCGLGAFLEHCATTEPGWRLHGTDVSEYARSLTRGRVPSALVESLSDIDRYSEHFDVITAFDVAEHLVDLSAFAVRIASLLKPSGALILVVPVYDGPLGPAVRLLDRDPTHLHKWSRSRWIDWVGDHFVLASWHGLLRAPLPFSRYLHLPTKRFRSVTPAIALVAHRH